jgi:transcriptional regulator with XRE-family HTH domain
LLCRQSAGHGDIRPAIGTNVKKLRNTSGQKELAHRAGINRSYLSEIENGHKNLGVLVLDYIAARLKGHRRTLR